MPNSNTRAKVPFDDVFKVDSMVAGTVENARPMISPEKEKTVLYYLKVWFENVILYFIAQNSKSK